VTWLPGQRATIDRQQIVTIDRVTKGGRAVVGDRQFAVDGKECGYRGSDRRLLELLTPEIETDMKLREKRKAIFEKARQATLRAEQWISKIYSPWRSFEPTDADVEKAERLAAAIARVIGDEE
jgi:hypothetical protein